MKEKKITSLSEIIIEQPEILKVSQIETVTHIICVNGDLYTEYSEISFTLDSGISVSIEELDKACDTYWNEWEKRSGF